MYIETLIKWVNMYMNSFCFSFKILSHFIRQTDPPVITVQGPPPFIEESFELIITSVVEPGNPENLAVFRWEFEPKYPGTQSQALPGQRENREVRIQSAVYSDAGIYRCTAGNTVGSDTAEIQIVVHCECHVIYYLSQGGINFMPICMSICLFLSLLVSRIMQILLLGSS